MKRSSHILGRLVRQVGLLLLLTGIGAGAGAGYGEMKTPTYVARAYVVVTGEPGEAMVAVNFAQAYGRIATEGTVIAQASVTLGTSRGLSRVTASTSPDAPVIEIVATGPRAGHTAAVANAVAQALVDFGTGRKEQTRVGLAVLAQAAVPRRPTSPRPPLELAVGGAAGLLIGGLAVLAGVGRPRRAGVPRAGQPSADPPLSDQPQPGSTDRVPSVERDEPPTAGSDAPVPVPVLAGQAGQADTTAAPASPSPLVGVEEFDLSSLSWYDEAAVLEYTPGLGDPGDKVVPVGKDAQPDRVVGRATVTYRSGR